MHIAGVSLYTTDDRCSIVIAGFGPAKAGDWKCQLEGRPGSKRDLEDVTQLVVARKAEITASVGSKAGDGGDFKVVVGEQYFVTCSASVTYPEARITAFFGKGIKLVYKGC